MNESVVSTHLCIHHKYVRTNRFDVINLSGFVIDLSKLIVTHDLTFTDDIGPTGLEILKMIIENSAGLSGDLVITVVSVRFP